MNKLKSIYLVPVILIASLFLSVVAFGGGDYFVSAVSPIPNPILDGNEEVLGANIPDRCEYYDQFASRSSKDLVKGSAGKLYSYRVVSNASTLRYFRLHNRTTTPVDSSDVVYAMPLDTTTASATPKVIEERFAVPMDFSTGIGWSISNTFATWSSQSDQGLRNSYFVTLCYY